MDFSPELGTREASWSAVLRRFGVSEGAVHGSFPLRPSVKSRQVRIKTADEQMGTAAARKSAAAAPVWGNSADRSALRFLWDSPGWHLEVRNRPGWACTAFRGPKSAFGWGDNTGFPGHEWRDSCYKSPLKVPSVR